MSDIAFKVLIGNGYDDVLFKTIMLKGEKGDQGEAGGALIDDTTTSTEKTWSSSKINSEISAKPSAFSQLSDVAIVNISDGQMAVYDFTTGKWKNQNVDASTLKYNSVKTIKDELDAKASSLTDLDDVNITNPQNDQGMIYDSTTGKWKNGNPAVSGDLDDLDDVQIDSNTLADGQAVKWDAQNNKWVNGDVSATTALANLTDVALDSSIPDSSSLVYNATEGKWENEQLNASQMPIQSGSATNTKDYIDTGLSGKADTSDTYTKTEVDNIVAGRKCSTYSIITLDTLTSTEQTFNTYGGRKFSDYDLYIFAFGSSDKNFRRTVVLTKSQWQSGANIDEGVLHGASTSTASSYDYCGIVVNYNTDTSIKAKVFGSGSINKFSVIGIKY